MLIRQHRLPDYRAGDIKRIDIYPEFITIQWRANDITKYAKIKDTEQGNQEFSQGH